MKVRASAFLRYVRPAIAVAVIAVAVCPAAAESKQSPREIEPGLSDESWTEVVNGVAAGEEVVVSGQFLIDSESRLQEAVGKLLGRTTGSAA